VLTLLRNRNTTGSESPLKPAACSDWVHFLFFVNLVE
jgi:hypothetical protein